MVHPARIQFLVRFGYDGSRFHGLQPQGPLPTAGAALRTRLEAALGARPKALCFAARTDAGVHALANAATCWANKPLDVPAFIEAAQRPRDDGLLGVRVFEVPYDVHARGSSRGKRYRYRIHDGCPPGELDSRAAWQVVPRLNVGPMREAAKLFEGTHDFTALRAARCTASSPIKTLGSVRVGGPFPLHDGTRLLFVDVAGDAFLRKMVRILVGTLAEVGIGWRSPDEVGALLAARDRTQAGVTAPARGLCLMKVGMAWPTDGSGLVAELAHIER
jgi:tRNA pseudouridine38-40 synthase